MYTKILLDSNVLIKREDNNVLSESLQNLLKLINNSKEFMVFIHPLSLKDIKNDRNPERREITLSKIGSYEKLHNCPVFDDDEEFKSKIKYERMNDYIDNSLLYALYRKRVNYLITEDLGIHKTAKKFNLEEQVLTIDEAWNNLNVKLPSKPSPIEHSIVDTLNLDDPIFDVLKEDYDDFEDWFDKIKNENRSCLKYIEKDHIGALLIYKKENEAIPLKNGKIPMKNRVKVCTFVVSSTGNRIGEFFVSWIVNYTMELGYDELYLTHKIKENDYLEFLIEEYGFINVGENDIGENIFIKSLNKEKIFSEITSNETSLVGIAKKFFPYYCDDERVNKYLVPIRPEFYEKLFLNDNQQSKLDKFINGYDTYPEDILALNPIKKAYLSHSNINLKEGDLLLFYESKKKGVADIGIVESTNFVENMGDLLDIVRKRSVYSSDELQKFIEKRTLVILFVHSKHFNYKVSLDELKKLGIISHAPQSIQKLSHDKYLKLKEIFKSN